ncbi:cyclic nucleotide-binding domain-containing protein [Arcicella aquatica]|uniref:Cyclic nucleotide-binding domain-containing protein n=1 Tax=Arcicella aquatica TaxID=217141 RepID=A0ABU5QNJ3_9BACT|nr:cyclic nucleotide-binding domain-containing protein [Arcicella aquatica]MEA5258645.1 cyclic nucleotide-binding domain-containing protein [Arcicella aquatica]
MSIILKSKLIVIINILREHIIERLGNNVPRLDEVLQCFKPLKIKRNEQILSQGEICKYVYFVAEGCLQVYVYDRESNENTRDIITENNWCSELMSFGSQSPATENIRAVEPCSLLAIDRQSFQLLVETVPQFDKVYKQILEASYANSVYRINTFVSLTALERIKWLMEYRPKLMTRLSSKLIASYLGISQETFSRLKAKL